MLALAQFSGWFTRSVPVLARGHADDATKHDAKVALIAEAYVLCDRSYGKVGCQHQVLRSADAKAIQMRHKCLPCYSAEKAHEMRFTHHEQFGSLFHRYVLDEVVIDIIEKWLQPLDVAALLYQGFSSCHIAFVMVH